MMRTVSLVLGLVLALGVGCSDGDASGEGERGAGSNRNGGDGDGDGPGDGDGDSPAGDGDGDGFGNTGAESPNLPTLDGGFRDASIGSPPGAPDEEGNCGGIEVEPDIMMETIPGNLLFVFDKSGSMCQNWTIDAMGTQEAKWISAEAAITGALTPLQDNVRAAAVFFPDTPSGGSCDVPGFGSAPQIPFQDGPDFLASWGSYWMGASCDNNAVDGNTPLFDVLAVADAALATAPMDGITNVVLITDGEPNCCGGGRTCGPTSGNTPGEPAGNLTPVIDTWLAAGIQTHVVGLPASSRTDTATLTTLLDSLAAAGGTTQHITASDPTALQTELAKIIGESVTTNFDSCSIGLPNAPPNLDDVNLTVVSGGMQQLVARDLGTGGGWTITPDGMTVILQGLFCDLAQEGEYDQISVVFGCVDLPPLPPPRPE